MKVYEYYTFGADDSPIILGRFILHDDGSVSGTKVSDVSSPVDNILRRGARSDSHSRFVPMSEGAEFVDALFESVSRATYYGIRVSTTNAAEGADPIRSESLDQ